MVTSRGKRPKPASQVIKKKVMDGLSVCRSTRLKKEKLNWSNMLGCFLE
jgi:hypothetical protein